MLPQPLTWASNSGFHLPLSLWGIGQCSPPILHLLVSQGAVVLLPSRTDPFSSTHAFFFISPPSPEVTESFGRVPLHQFSFRLRVLSRIHLCRFFVRFFLVSFFLGLVFLAGLPDLLLLRHSTLFALRFFFLSLFLMPFRLPPSLHLFPSLSAFQLLIRVRFTQLTFLSLLEPLDFRPFGFSPTFSLLMSTFSLLITFQLLSPTRLSRSTERSTTFLALPFWLSVFLGWRWTTASVTLSVSSIYGARYLIQYAATRLLSDGCFQAYCLVVSDLSLPSSLRLLLRPYRFVWAVSLLTHSTSLLLLDSISRQEFLRSFSPIDTLLHALSEIVLYLFLPFHGHYFNSFRREPAITSFD